MEIVPISPNTTASFLFNQSVFPALLQVSPLPYNWNCWQSFGTLEQEFVQTECPSCYEINIIKTSLKDFSSTLHLFLDPVPKFITWFQIRVIDTRFCINSWWNQEDETNYSWMTISNCLILIWTFCAKSRLRSLLFSFKDVWKFDIANTIMDILYEKHSALWEIFGNWVCTCHCTAGFPYLQRSWNQVRLPG